MQINILIDDPSSSDRLVQYVRTMTQHVLRGFEQDITSVNVRVQRQQSENGARRFFSELRVQRARGDELVLDGSGSYAHVSVEHTLESLWQLLRATRRSDAA